MMAANILSRPQTTATVTVVSSVFMLLLHFARAHKEYTTHTHTLTMIKFKGTTHAKMLKF